MGEDGAGVDACATKLSLAMLAAVLLALSFFTQRSMTDSLSRHPIARVPLASSIGRICCLAHLPQGAAYAVAATP